MRRVLIKLVTLFATLGAVSSCASTVLPLDPASQSMIEVADSLLQSPNPENLQSAVLIYEIVAERTEGQARAEMLVLVGAILRGAYGGELLDRKRSEACYVEAALLDHSGALVYLGIQQRRVGKDALAKELFLRAEEIDRYHGSIVSGGAEFAAELDSVESCGDCADVFLGKQSEECVSAEGFMDTRLDN